VGRVSKPLALVAAVALGVCGYRTEASSQSSATSPAARAKDAPVMTTKIRISVDGAVLTGSLNDSKAAQDFAAMLPLTLTLEDYNGTEKISDLSRKLSLEGAPAGFEPSAGDIAFYAPWGNLALFYRDFHYSSGLVSLGRIEAGSEALSRPGPIAVKIERFAE
jgi:hypothetical protein